MKDSTGTILTARQWQIIELRLAGRSTREIAALIGTGEQNVLVLENRVKWKIQRARNTLEMLDRMNSAATVLIEGGTHLLDAAKKVLDESDQAGVKLAGNVVDLMSAIRASCHDIIDNAVLTQSTAVYVDRDGRYSIHKFPGQHTRGK